MANSRQLMLTKLGIGVRLNWVGAAFVLFFALAMAGCGSSGDSADTVATPEPEVTQPAESDLGPAETVEVMLRAMLDKRLGEYYHYVSSADKEIKSLDSLQTEFSPARTDIVTDFLFSSTRFSIDSTLVYGDSAVVYLTSTAPPVPLVMQQANIVERDLGPETDMPTKMSILGERYKLSGAPREENHTTYRLVRERGGWRVNVGWAEMAAWLDSRIAEMESSSQLED